MDDNLLLFGNRRKLHRDWEFSISICNPGWKSGFERAFSSPAAHLEVVFTAGDGAALVFPTPSTFFWASLPISAACGARRASRAAFTGSRSRRSQSENAQQRQLSKMIHTLKKKNKKKTTWHTYIHLNRDWRFLNWLPKILADKQKYSFSAFPLTREV